jgi:RNA polymerase sigma factor (sigma-70 family)
LSEHELIRGCLRGSVQHQRALYEQFAGKMYGVCLRYARNPSDAADILQEGFLKVYTKLDQFQHQGSFEWHAYLVKLVENWWCPFTHEKKESYNNAKIDKSFWHIYPEDAIKLEPEDRDNEIWNDSNDK